MRTARQTLRRISAFALVVLCFATTARAHEGHKHKAMGTVKTVDAAKLDLETKEGKIESFVLTAETTYERADAAATHHDVAVGDRAVVTYESKEGKNVALEVALGVKKAESAAVPRSGRGEIAAEGAPGSATRP